jgi:hypothetical protein
VNWRASLTGAVIVAAAGLATGFAVGGKTTTTTKTRTLTLARTVTDTTTTASTTASTSSTVASTKAPTSTTGGQQQYYDDYLSAQNGDQLNNNGQNVSLDSNPASLQLKGQSYVHAVAFDLSADTTHPITERFQLPVPGFKHFSTPLAGLATNNSANANYKLTVYKDNDNPGATVLYSGSFVGPSGAHPISFDTQGATDLVLDWGQPSSGEPESEDQFILADPVVTH